MREGALNISDLKEALSDERCGLYFLAGLDVPEGGTSAGVLTVHVADGAITPSQARFIEASLATLAPDLELRLLAHSPRELYAPDCLEAFTRLFEHDHILADPTGAFTRGPQLLELTRKLRAELGDRVARVLWRAEDCALVIVASPASTRRASSGALEASEELRDEVTTRVKDSVGTDLGRAIRAVRVVASVGAGRHVPVDAASVTAPVRRRAKVGLLARVAGIAAMIGLGAATSAAAMGHSPDADENQAQPGIVALAGLTTLGENSSGVRNHYQAVGGLRLYLGESGVMLSTALSSMEALSASRRGLGNQRPIRVAY